MTVNQPQKGETNHMAQLKLTADILSAALEGFEVQKNRIDARIAEIKQMLDGGGTEAAAPTDSGKPQKKRSAAVRLRMQIAQQLRWKKIKEAAKPPQPGAAMPKKRKLSVAGRKRIIDATKKRWAAVKAAKQAGTAMAKKAGRKKAVAKKAQSAKASKRLESKAVAAKKTATAPEQVVSGPGV